MLVLLIGFVIIGPCFNASLKQRLNHTDSEIFITMDQKDEIKTQTDDTERIWYYGNDVSFQKQQGMKKRHSSKKQLKKLTKSYNTTCLNGEYVEERWCNSLLKRIVKMTVEINSVDRRHMFKTLFDMRIILCLNGTSIVHYNPDTEICCNGVHTRSSKDIRCCGGTLINSTTELCCNEMTLQRKENFRCCGQTTYDVREHLCCNGFLWKNLPNSECCGDNVYNNKSQVCCFEELVFDQTKGDSCCGQGVYNSSTSTCCEGVVQPKHEGEVQCCKNTSYNEACFKCVDGNLEPVYNTMEFVCCEGQVHTKRFKHFTGCCHRSIYDKRYQKCIYDQVLNGTVWDEDDEAETYVPDPTPGVAPYPTVIVVVGAMTVTAGLTGFGVYVCKRKKTQESYEREEKEVGHQNNALLQDGSTRVSVASLEESERHSIDGSMNLHLLNKNPLINEDNDLKSYYKDTQTQTGPEKASNCQTIFGKPFDYNFLLGPSNATVQMPESDVTMTLPQSVLKDSKVEVNCSSFSSISPMRRKLGLSDNERIASPVVEYALTGIGKLSEHALVVLPFFGPNDELKVRKFQSDEGLHAVVRSEEIPVQGKENENSDIFYIVKDWSVYIYTKSFSGFYCTTCRHRPLRLKAYLFGSYKRFTNPLRFEVRFALYIADELMKFADYSKRMFSNETTEGRIIKKEKQLKLPDTIMETDEIKASLTPTESHLNDWIHKLYPGSTDPIFAAEQVVKLKDVAEKCKDCPHCHLPEHDIPFQLEWYMVNKEGRRPCYTFQCIVFVDVHHLDDGSVAKNPVIIDELELRQEDRLPLEDAEFARNIRGIKEYLSRMSTQERDKIIRALALKTSCHGNNVDEVMQELQDKYKPKSVLEEVVLAFKENQMFVDLDCLLAYGFIPSYLSSTAVHPVCDALSEDRDSEDEGAEYCSARTTITQHAAENMGNAEQESPARRQEVTDSQAHTADINVDDTQLALIKLMHVNGEEARAEISQSFVCSYQDANNDAYKKVNNSQDAIEARGELQSRCLNKSPDSESQTLHAQEHASMEETTLKQRTEGRNSSFDG